MHFAKPVDTSNHKIHTSNFTGIYRCSFIPKRLQSQLQLDKITMTLCRDFIKILLPTSTATDTISQDELIHFDDEQVTS